MNIFWPKTPLPGNVGDTLSVPLLRALGITCELNWVPKHSHLPKLLASGSIIRFARPGDTVWGSGMIDRQDFICKDARYLCVRGPVTGFRARCERYGDPGLLCPLVWQGIAKGMMGNQVVVIPHYKDVDLVPKGLPKLSTLTAHPSATAKAISACDLVAASSLHGIIIAHAYGVPAGWWRPSNNLTGDDVKFLDYAESVGIELPPSETVEKVRFTLPDASVIHDRQKDLLDTLNELEL